MSQLEKEKKKRKRIKLSVMLETGKTIRKMTFQRKTISNKANYD